MNDFHEKSVTSEFGTTYYWTNEIRSNLTIVFLPGLTADHRLFESQLAFFQDKYRVLVWDCPCHGKSRPYGEFTYSNVSNELNHILENESVDRAVFVGQSFGGMIAQFYIDQHPFKAAGFISVDSVPFGDYYSKSDMFWLLQLEWMCKMFSDKLLRTSMAKMCGITENARNRMLTMLSSYTKNELCHLMYIGEAAFIPENKRIHLPCKCLLLLGEKDKTGKVAAYTKEWARRTGYPLVIIPGAAHNANDDQPDMVNNIILDFVRSIWQEHNNAVCGRKPGENTAISNLR